MKDETWAPRPYANEEFLSFDRLKRAVTSRVLDRAERLMGEEFPLSPERIAELTNEEWQRAKEHSRVLRELVKLSANIWRGRSVAKWTI